MILIPDSQGKLEIMVNLKVGAFRSFLVILFSGSIFNHSALAQPSTQTLICTKYHLHNRVIIDCNKAPNYDPTRVNVQVEVNSNHPYSSYSTNDYYIYNSGRFYTNPYIIFNSTTGFSRSYQRHR